MIYIFLCYVFGYRLVLMKGFSCNFYIIHSMLGLGMHMADSPPNSEREGGLPGNRTCRGPLESGSEPSQPPAGGSNLISRHAPRVSGGTEDRDRRPRVQDTPTDYGHDGGGPLQGISVSPEVLQHLILGKGPRPSHSIQGWSQDG